VRYAPEFEPEVQAFQELCYPNRDPVNILPNWRWLLVDRARRLGIEPYVWMYRKSGRIVAHQGAVAVRLKLGDGELVTGWFVETMAAEEIRGSPVGPMLVQKSLEDLPLNLSLGQTEQMRELQYALGWKKVRDLNNWMYVCGRDFRPGGKPSLLQRVAGSLLGRWHEFRLSRHRAGFRRGRWTVTEASAFGEEHDRLWQRAATHLKVAVVRDAGYLDWKYRQRPVGGFRVLEIRRGQQLCGLAATLVVGPDSTYPYRRGFITDLVVPSADDDAISALLYAAIESLAGESASTVSCQLGQPQLEAALQRFGFIDRGPRHQLLIATGGLDDATAAFISDSDAWYISMGDSDVDAYPG